MNDLKIFAKPGVGGQVYVSLDSLVGYLKGEESKIDGQPEFNAALESVAYALEEVGKGVREYQKTIGESLQSGPSVSKENSERGETKA